MPGTITEDGEPVNYVVHYFRLGRERRERSDSLSAAFWSMLSGADNGMCAPEDIESADGHVLIDRATLQAPVRASARRPRRGPRVRPRRGLDAHATWPARPRVNIRTTSGADQDM